MKNKLIFNIFFSLVALAFVAPLINFVSFLFPYVTSKVFVLRILIEAALPFYICLLVLEKPLRPNLRNPLNFSVLAFLVINFIAAIFGVNIGRSLWGNFERMGGVFYLAHLTLLYFYILLIGQKGGVYIKRVVLWFLTIATAVSLNGLFGKMNIGSVVVDPSLPERVSSTLGNPIFLASYLIPALALSLFFYLGETERNKKYFYLGISALFLLITYFTGTRGAFVGIFIGAFLALVVYLFFAQSKQIKIKVASALGVVVVLAAMLLVFGKSLPDGSTLKRLANLNDSNAQARLIQWGTALQGFYKHPVLGVGPENYFFVSNEFYNTELAKYDASWFDKPHNYWLEILDTTGILGMVAYLAMVGFALLAYFKAKKADLISGSEATVLVFGMTAYQIQNLFVFDTASASISFFVYLGFAGYLWLESRSVVVTEKPNLKNLPTINPANPLFIGGIILTLYIIYVGNFLPIQLGQYINIGSVLHNKGDFENAKKYFLRADELNINFDYTVLFQKYSDMALAAAQSNKKLPVNFVKDTLEQGVKMGEKAVTIDPTNPVNWYYLSSLSYFDSLAKGEKGVPEKAAKALAESIKLAPNRKEILFLNIKYKESEENFEEALKLAENYYELYPQYSQSSWEVAWVNYKLGNLDKAYELGSVAVDQGQQLNTLAENKLFIDYYQSKKDYPKVVEYYKKSVDVASTNIEAYIGLVKAYMQNGQTAEAREFANKIIASAPDRQMEIEMILAGSWKW